MSGLPEVIYLEGALTVDALFTEVAKVWKSEITDRNQVKLAVNFSSLE